MASKKREEYGVDGVWLGDEELDLIDRYQSQYNAAKAAGNEAAMNAAHAAAEQVRARHNYSGGGAGDEYIPLDTGTPSAFSYDRAPEYVSRYQEQIDALADEILNRPSFSYDYRSDPNWQSYRKEYVREGRRAEEDTLGRYAAMTGGVPSTAAVTAARQAGDYYNAQLADKLPELYQTAYEMYLEEADRAASTLNALRSLESADYGRYTDRLNQYNSDRNFAYGSYNDRLGQEARTRQEAAERIDAFLSAGGDPAELDAALVSRSGYTEAELAAMRSEYLRRLAEQQE